MYTWVVNPIVRSISWAVYLAMSWTWCIGMFLPVILVSEFGIGAWFVFAVPNVLGAAAMGWTLARPGTSKRLLAEHRFACVAFSAVTLAFQAYFLIWFSSIGVIPGSWAIAALTLGIVIGVVNRKAARWDLLLAWLVLALSLTVLGKGLTHLSVPHMIGELPQRSRVALLCLAPICAFGFLLCPYLDVTFHRAKQATDASAGRFAFTLGFGVFFLLMILLTLLYEGDLSTGNGSFALAGVTAWVGLHLTVQIGFKFVVHLRALPRPRRADLVIWIFAGALVIGGVVALRQQQWFAGLHDHQKQMLTGELVYRLFMSFYGLVFPTYVWVCMVPIKGPAPGPTKPALLACALGILVATPMFWLGFIDEKMPWLLGGFAAVLSSRGLLAFFSSPSHRAGDEPANRTATASLS
jgi:hypothetical protein